MANEASDKTLSPPLTALRLINDAIQSGAGYDNLISVLSLWCLLLILQRQNPTSYSQPAAGTAAANPLQKLIGELGKGDGSGPSSDTLMSLLPLLNSPQVKSKMNPANIATILSLINSLGGSSSAEKHEKSDKHEKAEPRPEEKNEPKKEQPAATITTSATNSAANKEVSTEDMPVNDKKDAGRSLNWKNF